MKSFQFHIHQEIGRKCGIFVHSYSLSNVETNSELELITCEIKLNSAKVSFEYM